MKQKKENKTINVEYQMVSIFLSRRFYIQCGCALIIQTHTHIQKKNIEMFKHVDVVCIKTKA